jgi:hypothetical protein
MNHALTSEILRLGGDPSDEVWIWLVTRGPHGDSFTWGQTRSEPPGYVGVLHLAEIVEELMRTVPNFQQRIRKIISDGMQSQLPNIVRRSIQVAAIVGSDREWDAVNALKESDFPEIASDARACIFYSKHGR